MKIRKLGDILQEWYDNEFGFITTRDLAKAMILMKEEVNETRNLIQAKSGQEVKDDPQQLVGEHSTAHDQGDTRQDWGC
jgi:hypothetical protein